MQDFPSNLSRQILDASKLEGLAYDNFKFDENGRKLQKWKENTVGKGEITSNFSFSHSVFKRIVLQSRKNQGLFGKGLKRNAFLTFAGNGARSRYTHLFLFFPQHFIYQRNKRSTIDENISTFYYVILRQKKGRDGTRVQCYKHGLAWERVEKDAYFITLWQSEKVLVNSVSLFFLNVFTFWWRNPLDMMVIRRPQMDSIWTSQESVVK